MIINNILTLKSQLDLERKCSLPIVHIWRERQPSFSIYEIKLRIDWDLYNGY